MKFLILLLFPLHLFSQPFEGYLDSLYKECELESRLSYSLFYRGMIGYYNLKKEKKVTGDKLIIVDFRQSSINPRFYVIDLTNTLLLYQTVVAHGRNSGNKHAISFSNKNGTYKSSLGFYKTAETYYGNNGLSLRLEGLDPQYNNNARVRKIVIHGASYVTREEMGRSHGCLVLPLTETEKIINIIKEGNCLLVYTKEYTGRYLNLRTAREYYDSLKKEEDLYKLLIE